MPANRYATPEVLAEVRRLKAELSEEECRKRADRMAHQHSAEGREEMKKRLRESCATHGVRK